MPLFSTRKSTEEREEAASAHIEKQACQGLAQESGRFRDQNEDPSQVASCISPLGHVSQFEAMAGLPRKLEPLAPDDLDRPAGDDFFSQLEGAVSSRKLVAPPLLKSAMPPLISRDALFTQAIPSGVSSGMFYRSPTNRIGSFYTPSAVALDAVELSRKGGVSEPESPRSPTGRGLTTARTFRDSPPVSMTPPLLRPLQLDRPLSSQNMRGSPNGSIPASPNGRPASLSLLQFTEARARNGTLERAMTPGGGSPKTLGGSPRLGSGTWAFGGGRELLEPLEKGTIGDEEEDEEAVEEAREMLFPKIVRVAIKKDFYFGPCRRRDSPKGRSNPHFETAYSMPSLRGMP